MNRWVPAVAGIAGITASAVAADVWAARTDRPTVSAAVGAALNHPVGGVVVAGGIAGLAWHLICDPTIRRLATRIAEEAL